MAGPRRTKSSEIARPSLREDVFLPTSGPGVSPRAVGVAELLRRLSVAEAKLQASEKDHAADAELIGNLLGEIADRDRRIKGLEQREIEREAQLVELETQLTTVASRSSMVDDRTRELETALRRTDGLFAELLHRLNESHGGESDLSELHDLLAVTLGTLDLTRTIGAENARKLDEVRTAMSNVGARDVERALGATHARAQHVLDVSVPLDRAIARVVDRLRDIEHRERDLNDLRGELLSEAGALILEVQSLRDAMGNLAKRPGSIPRIGKPARSPPRR